MQKACKKGLYDADGRPECPYILRDFGVSGSPSLRDHQKCFDSGRKKMGAIAVPRGIHKTVTDSSAFCQNSRKNQFFQKRVKISRERIGYAAVVALDAAMPFDYESRAIHKLEAEKRLKIGIVGFGTFGQFLARRLVSAGHSVIATSRGTYHKQAQDMGAVFFSSADDFCEQHPDVVVLASSILSLQDVVRSLPISRLKRNTLFVDVLSVKEFPKKFLLSQLPPEVDILCTHPMFGPDSGRESWKNLNFMYDKVRIGKDMLRQKRLQIFLDFFENEGCTMVEMACEEHDKQAASSQFITHTVGRMLGAMELEASPIDTKGFQSLLSLVDNTANDSFELYYGLFMYNQNATTELDRLEKAFDAVKKKLFDQLHDKLREQMFDLEKEPSHFS